MTIRQLQVLQLAKEQEHSERSPRQFMGLYELHSVVNHVGDCLELAIILHGLGRKETPLYSGDAMTIK